MRSLAIAGAVIILGACHASGAQGNEARHHAQRTFQVGAFDKIALSGSPDVVVAVGGAPSVRAEGDSSMVERLEVTVENGQLHIGVRNGGSWSWFGHHDGVTVYVTVPSLAAASVAGSGDMRIDRAEGPRFTGSVSGSGGLTVAALQAPEAAFSLTGSGDVRAAGTAQHASLSIVGSGDIDLSGLQTGDATVSLTGSGDASIHATGTAAVELMGSGDVTVTGGAHCTISKAGSGDVRCG
jgi:hypothetical protein